MRKSDKNRKKYKRSSIKNSNIFSKYLHYLILSVIIILTFIIYSDSLKNDFVSWDDSSLLINNNEIRNITTENIGKMFSNSYVYMYVPLTVLSFAIEYKFFALNPVAYHAGNLILHLLNVILVFFFIYLLTSPQSTNESLYSSSQKQKKSNYRILVSSIVALFFGIHPMHVESVAWASERKDVLYSFFFLCGLITYIYYLKNQKFKYIAYTFILFILSLFSKSSAVVFPLVLVLIDYYLKNVKTELLSIKYWLRKLPFILVSVIFGILAIHFQTVGERAGDMTDLSHYSGFDRLFLYLYSASFYIVKFFIPLGLCGAHFYPVKSSGMLPIEYYFSAVLISGVVITIILIKSLQLKKDLIFGILFYFITIVLFLKIIPSTGFVITCERFSYISYVGLIFAFVKVCLKVADKEVNMPYQKKHVVYKSVFITVLIFATLIFSIMTYERNKVWANSLSLLDDVIEKNSNAYSQIINRGMAKNALRDYKGAIEDFNKAIENSPRNVKAYFSRGLTKSTLGDFHGAIEDYNKALEYNPNFGLAFNNRGLAKSNLGDKKGALEDFNKAIETSPKFSDAFYNRGALKSALGDKTGALNDYNTAIEYNPQNSLIFNNRGYLKASQGEIQGAMNDFNKAIELNPQYANAFYNRGTAKYLIGDKDGGCLDWRKAGELGVKQAEMLIEKYCK